MLIFLFFLAFLRNTGNCILSRSWGVNIHFTNPQPGVMQQLSQGFRTARMDFTWSKIEKHPGEYDFSAYDRLLAEQEKLIPKVNAYWILDYGNPLYDAGLAPTSTTAIEAFTNFTLAAIQHFTGHTIIWEMWNEPNGGFWKPKPNVDAYSALAKSVGQALKNKFPDEIFIGPATSGIDLKFLEGCFKNGLLDYWDAVSVHPYRNTGPETVLSEYENIRTLMRKFGKSLPIISGEWGWSTCHEPCSPGTFTGYTSESLQANYLVRQMLVNTLAGVPVSIFYDWQNDGVDPTVRENEFGTVNNAYCNSTMPHLPKLAFRAAQVLQKQLADVEYQKRINVSNHNVYVLQFTKNRYAIWSQALQSTDCVVKLQDKQDCGYNGIVRQQCTNRGCCFQDPYISGPQCYIRNQYKINISFPVPSKSYNMINMIGDDLGIIQRSESGILKITVDDRPVYLSAKK